MEKKGKMLINKEQNQVYPLSNKIYNAPMNFYFYSE